AIAVRGRIACRGVVPGSVAPARGDKDENGNQSTTLQCPTLPQCGPAGSQVACHQNPSIRGHLSDKKSSPNWTDVAVARGSTLTNWTIRLDLNARALFQPDWIVDSTLTDRTPRPKGDGFRRDIQGLRALAVLMVVVFHARLPFPGGFVGVDVFF